MHRTPPLLEPASRSRRLLGVLGAVVLALVLQVAAAAEPHDAGPHDTGPMRFDEQLTLHAVFELARERHPRLGLVGAQERRARAESDYAGRWLPDSALASGYHLSDQPLDNLGMYEDEIALSLPLWMPGEKQARSRLADAASASATAGAAAFDWRVSAELRDALWGLLQARRRWELAVEQQTTLEGVLEQARIFEESGDLARGDTLAVVQELGRWRSETLALEAAWQDAARTYRALTGAVELPGAYEERQSDRAEIGDDHPALQVARDRVAEASAHLESLRKGNNFRPSVQLFWRNNRPDDRSPADSALGIGFEVPLGRSPSRKPEVAAADELVAQAQAQLLEQERELRLQLHEAEHELHTIERQLQNAEGLMEAAETRRQLDALELELGEIGLQEWLRRANRFNEIRQEHELLLLRRGAAVAAYNQAVGVSL